MSDPFNTDIDIFQGITLVFRETTYERNQTMYNDIVAKLQDVKQYVQYMLKIYVSDDLNPDLDPIFVSSNLPPDPSADLASREIVVSSDLAPDLDPVQAITPVFSETSKFFTPLQCDLEPEINKPTSKKIDVSSNLSPDPSSDLASRKIVISSDLDPDPSAGLDFTGVIAQGFSEPFLLNSSCCYFETIDEERKLSNQLWYAGQKLVWLRMVEKFMTTYFLRTI